MRPVAVVMVDVDPEHVLELPPARDQDPVETVAANGANPALGKCVRLRCPEWGANDLDALAPEDLVKGAAELAVTVVDQETKRRQLVRQRPCELTRLLSDPVGCADSVRALISVDLRGDRGCHPRRLAARGTDVRSVPIASASVAVTAWYEVRRTYWVSRAREHQKWGGGASFACRCGVGPRLHAGGD